MTRVRGWAASSGSSSRRTIGSAGRRADEAAQEKLNVLAEALAALMESRAVEDSDLREATEKLREAVGLEERH